MKPICIILVLGFSLTLSDAMFAAAKKQSAVAIRFYPEAGAEGGNFSQKIELMNPRRVTYMAEMPLITEREVKAYYPFQARDGSFGIYLKLDNHGADLLAQHTMSRRGSYVFVFFNGRRMVDLYVDRAVQDGIAVIPSGLNPTDIELLNITFPMMGHEGEKPSKKKAFPKVRKAKPVAASAP